MGLGPVALLAAAGMVLQSTPENGHAPPRQQLVILTMASAGCMMSKLSERYTVLGDPAIIADESEKSCDSYIVNLHSFNVKHPGLSSGQQTSVDQMREAFRGMARMFVIQIRGTSPSKMPFAHPVSPLLPEGPFAGRFDHFGSPEERNTELNMAQIYCSKIGRRAIVEREHLLTHSLAFRCI